MTHDKASEAWLTGAIFSGHYELGSLIARGGMAEVYHGVDLWSNNPVAVKVLLPQFTNDVSVQQKFFREERSLRQVRHGAVVSVIDSGTDRWAGSELMFLVLEYVHGCTLHQLLRVRPVLSVAEALEVMLPIVEGLSEVHALSLIHRDIKPGNVLMSSETESVKIADFGLTRRTDQSWTGSLMGTPPYVAPEIVSSQGTVSARSDIFALGIMLYRMLSGRLPFGGMDDQQVLYNNVHTELPEITRYAPDLPRDIVGIIKWCTRKDPQARPENATELFTTLSDIAQSLSESELEYCASRSPHDLPLWEAVEHIAELSGANEVAARRPITAFSAADDLEDDGLWEQTLAEETEGSPVALDMVDAPDTEPDDAPAKHQPISAQSPLHGAYRANEATANDPHLSAESNWQQASAPSIDPHQVPEPYLPAPSSIKIATVGIVIFLLLFCASFLGWWLATALLSSALWQGFL
ncbi:serine/threonine-protein kinase [Rothia sp. ZJ932]|uniref:serine/threonine protein kinase n=1 Tax=Rothia sp. ZJ932 TaxID=2810516 RepID=UPI001966F117|nr:serine/threonine-protein kinase [Rothia sp. ZJ932]QRZ60948.1 serine/threonine protein kinase [Rothia sp. ZJ932]